MSAVAEFMDMGGYAFYVWSAYAIVGVVLVGNALHPIIRARRVRQSLARQLTFERRREEHRSS